MKIKRVLSLTVAVCFLVSTTGASAFAYEAECLNKEGKFSTCKAEIEDGVLTVTYKSKSRKELNRAIPGKSITALAGGEYARRRVGESVGLAFVSVAFLFMLFAKKKRDNFGIEYMTAEGTKDSITIQLKKKYGFAFGQQLQAISGQTIVYEDKAPTAKELKAAKKEQEKEAKEAAREQAKKMEAAQAAEAAAGTAADVSDEAPVKVKRGNKYRR